VSSWVCSHARVDPAGAAAFVPAIGQLVGVVDGMHGVQVQVDQAEALGVRAGLAGQLLDPVRGAAQAVGQGQLAVLTDLGCGGHCSSSFRCVEGGWSGPASTVPGLHYILILY